MNRPAQSDGFSHRARIAELEGELDPMVRNRGPERPLDPHLQVTLREWSRAIWTVAESLGPTTPRAHDLEQGLSLAQRPVFVCGAARSGTTLLRDLLDGHPQLAVVPTESLFYTYLEPALFALRPDSHSSYLGRRWLERLVVPPPYWLLGCSAQPKSPYVTFARAFAGWWQVPAQRRDARFSSWPIAALALAYAQSLGGGNLPPTAQMWVEKTPGSERFLWRIWRDFPRAKVIHIVRRPEAVLASIKGMRPQERSRRHTLLHIVRHMAPSYRAAAECARHLPKARYCLVRYEDLTADPDAVMFEIANFLGIDRAPSLLQPTVAGRPATNNTSFGSSRPDLHGALDPVERGLLALAVGRPAAKLGYAPLKPSLSTRHGIVGSLAQREGADALAADGVSPHVQPLAPGDRLG
jgi:hypothetical protein